MNKLDIDKLIAFYNGWGDKDLIDIYRNSIDNGWCYVNNTKKCDNKYSGVWMVVVYDSMKEIQG